MIVYILVITTLWSFAGGYQQTPRAEVVSSVESAAWIVKEKIDSAIYPEPDQCEYKLYSINLETKEIKEVEIPKIKIEFIYKKGD